GKLPVIVRSMFATPGRSMLGETELTLSTTAHAFEIGMIESAMALRTMSDAWRARRDFMTLFLRFSKRAGRGIVASRGGAFVPFSIGSPAGRAGLSVRMLGRRWKVLAGPAQCFDGARRAPPAVVRIPRGRRE